MCTLLLSFGYGSPQEYHDFVLLGRQRVRKIGYESRESTGKGDDRGVREPDGPFHLYNYPRLVSGGTCVDINFFTQ